jgi:L-alanine-DL-glutamate epimerase-like enolase superfamily enzyme
MKGDRQMKITDVKCYVVPRAGVKSTFHWRKGLRMPNVPDTVDVGYIKVETDEGYVGHTAGQGYATADLVHRYLKHELIGQNPLLTEHLWHRGWELHRLGGGLESVLFIDAIAWDIKSQVAGLPLYLIMSGISRSVWMKDFLLSNSTLQVMPNGTQHYLATCAAGLGMMRT